MSTQEQIDAAVAAQHERGEADDWWWLVAKTPNRDIHLYELGYAQETDEHANPDDPAEVTGTYKTPLPPERRAVILAELGAPDDAGAPESGWDISMAPGRPNTYLEAKAYDGDGRLLPLKARTGVTLHLIPENEPGTAEANGETPAGA